MKIDSTVWTKMQFFPVEFKICGLTWERIAFSRFYFIPSAGYCLYRNGNLHVKLCLEVYNAPFGEPTNNTTSLSLFT